MKRAGWVLLPILTFLAGAAAMAGWHARQAQRAEARQASALGGARMSAPPPANAAGIGAPAGVLPEETWPQDAPTPEQVLYAQPALMHREAAKLQPRTPGKVNLYAIVFAGDGSQGVFRNEAEYFDKLFSQRLGAAGHVMVLENNPASLTTRPLASWTNLENALDAVASRMDTSQDILLLYFTTHGSEDHTLLVDMDPLPLDQISAGDLPDILDEHDFKYKVVIVNACYSGGFIPPLRDPDTLVITAARSDRSSFGCGEQSELTWFGHAFLVNALNETDNLQQAFRLARTQVAGWEQRERFEPSEPRIWVGRDITPQLAKWRQRFVPGPAVPFEPAAAAPSPAATAGNTP
jgi:hypothetical protein